MISCFPMECFGDRFLQLLNPDDIKSAILTLDFAPDVYKEETSILFFSLDAPALHSPPSVLLDFSALDNFVGMEVGGM